MKNNPLPRFVLLAIVGLACADRSSAAEAAPARKPNIVVIIADDLGFADVGVGVHGNREIPTPNIDSIATSGVRFTSGYVSGPYCSPTRAGLLTGRYQQRFGHEFNPNGTNGLPLTEVTLADRLSGAGYTSGAIGKWHLGTGEKFHPLSRGFSEFFGFLGAAHSYTNLSTTSPNPIYRGREAVEEKEYLTDAFTREALSFIDRNKEKPFYLHLAFNAVHSPLDADPKYAEPFKAIADEKRRNFAALYAALDAGVGRVLAKLKDERLDENTLIFFFSDNGGHPADNTSKNDPLRGSKFQTWEGGVHVPFYLRWRGKLTPGLLYEKPVIQLDVHATALAAAGIEAKPEWKLDGVNLLPFVTGQNKGEPHEALYWRFGQQLAVRKGDWKLVKAYNGPGGFAGGGGGMGGGRAAANTNSASPNVQAVAGAAGQAARAPQPYVRPTLEGAELFNLSKDLAETTNLAAKEPAKVKELAALWSKWNAELVDPAWGGGPIGGTFGGPRYTFTPADALGATTSGVAGRNAAAVAGPWKLGDTVPAAQAPQIANKTFVVSAEITPDSGEGVIAAIGATANGFALFLHDGKLAFAARVKSELTTVVAPGKLPAGPVKVEARFEANGAISVFINGTSVAEGKAGGLIPRQPAEGLTVGSDGAGAVGEYTAPNEFKGKVENVTFRYL